MQAPTHFYDTSFFSAALTSFTTFLVGLVAFIVYEKQKSDKKKNAATILLLEIRDAEEHLLIAKESILKDGLIKEDIFVLPVCSWEKYSYLFARDFNAREWRDVTTFYEKCKLYDQVVIYNNTFFVKNTDHIRANLHQSLADYTKSYINTLATPTEPPVDQKEVLEQYKQIIDAFATTFMQEITSSTGQYFYRPQKTISDAKALVETIRVDLSTSTVGTKLQNIIDQNLRTRIVDWLLGRKNSQI